MFNITAVKQNSRCNGLYPSGSSTKRSIHMSNVMAPNRLSESRIKFSDRLKSYLTSDPAQSDGSEADDPYQFSDPDPKVKSVANKSKAAVEYMFENKMKNVKMINSLQTQIARNKVSVKHNRVHRQDGGIILAEKVRTKGTSVNIMGKSGERMGPAASRNTDRRSGDKRSCWTMRGKQPTGKPLPAHLKARRCSTKSTHHEALQRIQCATGEESDGTADVPVYQRHWFSKELELLMTEEGPREARLELTRLELRRHLLQINKSKVGQPSRDEQRQNGAVERLLSVVRSRRVMHSKRVNSGAHGSLRGRMCQHDSCGRPALPCTLHCARHIMHNKDQVLFEFCTAKFSDNTQCSVPVFDIAHELPLCIEHARKRDNYNRMCLETKPKKPRRKVKPSAMIRPQKRSKKRRKTSKSDVPQPATNRNSFSEIAELNVCETSSAYESSEEMGLGGLSESEFIKQEEHDVVEQVLAMSEEVGNDLELVTVDQQESRLLEETDFTNVLNQIPPDEFNDLFAVDRNGVYEPSREETEELERALEAVDEDVKSLEKLSQTQGLLDSLLDEHTLVESLVQIPDIYPNGYSSSEAAASSRQNAVGYVPMHVEGIFSASQAPS